jgi:hypothetical protein
MIDVADNNAVYYYHFDGLGSVIVLSNVSIFHIGTARRKIVGKYQPFVEQATANIEDLSRGVSAAREELRRLQHEK